MLIKKNWFSRFQHGFRCNESCEDILSYLVHKWTTDLKDQMKRRNGIEAIHMLCFDFSKAFDSVWVDGLLYKMYKSGVNGKLFKLLPLFNT